MNKTRSFSEPGCIGCEAHLNFGLSRYCAGFKNKKRRKAFRKSDPAYKAPKWCPKRKDPCEYRIYSYADERAAVMAHMFEEDSIGGGTSSFPARSGTGCARRVGPGCPRKRSTRTPMPEMIPLRCWMKASRLATWWRSTQGWPVFFFLCHARFLSGIL